MPTELVGRRAVNESADLEARKFGNIVVPIDFTFVACRNGLWAGGVRETSASADRYTCDVWRYSSASSIDYYYTVISG